MLRPLGAALGLFAALVYGTPCRAEKTELSLEIVRPMGDVYNERTTDGDAYPQSIGLRGALARGHYALLLDYRRNAYLTESGGPGSLTRYARIEGGFGAVTPFVARESAFEARFERRLGALHAGIGLLRTWTNYHYPMLTGIGGGLELRAAAAAGVRPFASAFYYPSASGAYSTESTPSQVLQPAFQIIKLEGGLTLRTARSPLSWTLGYANETRSGRGLASDVRLIRSDPYAALGLRL